MDSIRLKVSRSTITACFWFFASVIYFLGIAVIPVSIQCLCGRVYRSFLVDRGFLCKEPVMFCNPFAHEIAAQNNP